MQFKKYARTAAAAFFFLWVVIVFAGAEIKLHNAPPSQDGCFIRHIAQHLNLKVRPDCKADDSIISLITATEEVKKIITLSELANSKLCSKFEKKRECERKGCDWTKGGNRYKSCNDPAPANTDNVTLSQLIGAATLYANTTGVGTGIKKRVYEAIAVVNTNPDLFEVALEIEQGKYNPETTLTLGQDRYIGPWRTGKTAFAGKAYKCSETLFANDVGDYFNFLMGNVCTGAIEMRCIFSRITHILMSASAFFIMVVVCLYDRQDTKELPWISTVIAILCFLLIVILPLVAAVQTGKSVAKSFAAPGTNKHLGSKYEFGLVAPLFDPLQIALTGEVAERVTGDDFYSEIVADGATFAGSLLRLGTIPHDTQGECGLGWSESVVALIENVISPVTLHALRPEDGGDDTGATILTALLAILDMLKYTVELTVVFYLRLITIPVAIVLLFCTVGAGRKWTYTFMSVNPDTGVF